MRNTKDPRAAEVLRFWFDEGSAYGVRRKCWFTKDPAFDAQLERRFRSLYETAAAQALTAWHHNAGQCLALIVVLDQFPRNMFRGDARAFATDALALEAARHALSRHYDRDALAVERMFFYLPFEHSESLADQKRCCELMAPLAGFADTEDAYRYAERHREIIERFGRFPHRNGALHRASTPQEAQFLTRPGSGF